MAPHGALGQEAKPQARVEHRPFCPGLDAQSLVAFEVGGLHPPPEICETSLHPSTPYPWNSSSSLGRWAQAEEVESIGQEQVVWIRERVAVIEKEKTWSEQAEAVREEEGWLVTSLTHPSSASPQSGQTGLLGASA